MGQAAKLIKMSKGSPSAGGPVICSRKRAEGLCHWAGIPFLF